MPGVDWKFCAEVDPFACAVIKHHRPKLPNLGDVNAEDFAERARAYGPIDLLVAGAPCQDFSVAGQRAGMGGARGNLSLRFVELVGELRPTWLLFENVPGLLSSASHEAPSASPPPDDLQPGQEWSVEDDYEVDEGSDLGYFLSALLELRYSLAYTVLDAQFFNLAQRRERLFVVGHAGELGRSGAASNWLGAAKNTSLFQDAPRFPTLPAAVLFDLESLSGNPAPSRATGQGSAGTLSARSNAGGGLGTDFEIGGGIQPVPLSRTAGGKSAGEETAEDRTQLSQCFGGNRTRGGRDVATAVNAHGGSGRMDFESETFVLNGISEYNGTNPTLRSKSGDCGGGSEALVAHALRADGFDASEDGTGRGTPIIAFCNPGGDTALSTSEHTAPPITTRHGDPGLIAFSSKDHGADAGDVAPTLRAMEYDESHANGGGQVAVAFQTSQSGVRQAETHATLDANNGGRRHNGVISQMAVRRLTPVECARLQGFEDHYLDIEFHGKPAADGNKYRALGNSMAVPVLSWLGERIRSVHEISLRKP